MNVTEVLYGLGSWSLTLREDTPARITDALGIFGHAVIVDGPVDLEATGDATLAAARYVGVMRDKDENTLSGNGLVFWLGDEDDKGPVLESKVTLTSATLAQAVTTILALANGVTVGTINAQTVPAARITQTFQFVTVRSALTTITEAFGTEFRVNPNGSVDVGTVAQLYGTSVDAIISRRGAAGSDVDLRSLGADFATASSGKDFTGRVVLLGQTQPTGVDEDPVTFATGSANLPVNPYKNLRGNPVQATRLISESGEPEGTVAQRAQLHINRFGKIARSLTVTAQDYETTDSKFRVGMQVYVYDPDAGIFDISREVQFQGQPINPAITRITEATWQAAQGMTVAFRTQEGVWLDLTPFVAWEAGGDTLVVSDLPRSLTNTRDSLIGGRLDSIRAVAPDASVPSAPTNLVLESAAYLAPDGRTLSYIKGTWTAPTTNTDATALVDLSHYEVAARWTSRAWGVASVTDATTAELAGFPGNLPHEFRVRAVDRGGKPSAWTTVGITTAKDSIAPQAPADPVLSSFIGMLRVDVSRLGADGNPLPTDTKQINVHVSTTSGFTPTTATRVDAVPPSGGPSILKTGIGTTVYVRLQAEDQDGNLSQPSGQVTGAAALVGDNEVATLGVGHLTTGLLNAVVTVGQRVIASPTGLTTGQRAELYAGGLRAFDAAEVMTVDLNGVSNLLMGRLMTAPVGQRRMDIGAAGAAGSVNFYAPDGRLTRLIGWTSSWPTAGIEAIGLNVPVFGTAYTGWNTLSLQSDERTYLVSKDISMTYGGSVAGGEFRVEHATDRGNGATPPQLDTRLWITEQYGTVMYDNGNRLRLWLSNDGGFLVYDGDDINNAGDQRIAVRNDDTTIYNPAGPNNSYLAQGQVEVRRDQTIIRGKTTINGDDSLVSFRESVAPGSSTRLLFFNRNNFAGMFKYYYIAGDIGGERFEFRNAADTAFIPVFASAFTVNSDREAKHTITDLEPEVGDLIDSLKPRRYWRKGGAVEPVPKKGTRAGQGEAQPVPDVEQIGFVTDEMDPRLVVGDPAAEGASGIDVMALLTATIVKVQTLTAMVEQMQRDAQPPTKGSK